jgi:hypothetical protein
MKDIEVLHFADDKASSEFTIQNPLTAVTGRDGLAQRIIKIMFTQISSDVFHPDSGTIFYDLMRVYADDELESVRSTFPVIIKNLEEQVKNEQTEELLEGKILSDDEILSSLSLKSYVWDEIYGGWILTLEVNTQNGEQIYVQIP